jgi:hypothetical protein
VTAHSSPRGRRATRRRRRQERNSTAIVTLLVAAAAAGGALAGCHPTGTPIVDPVYGALAAAVVTSAASKASRATLLLLAAVAAALSRGWLLVPGAAVLLMAFASVFPRRSHRRVGALIGALAIQVILRWPPVGFQGLTALIGVAAVLPCLISGLAHLSGRWRRRVLWTGFGFIVALLVLAVPVAVGALSGRSAIDGGIAATEGALTNVTKGSTFSGVASLDAATADFNVAAQRTGSWWTDGGRLIPVVAQQRQAIARATTTAHAVVASASQDASTMDLSSLKVTGGRLDLARIRDLAAPIANLEVDLQAAQTELRQLRSPWLASPIQGKMNRLGAQLTKARSGLTLAAEAVKVAPAILGGDGVRHYFVAFMTPSESRGLDGLIGSYGELTVDNGQISLSRSGDVTQLNDVAKGSRHITGPTDYLARYGAFQPGNNFQDLTYSPDFPTVADVISQMYPQSGGGHIDGVLALDPDALASLLKLTGPITVPGLPTPLTAANAAEFLLKGQYIQFGASEVAEQARHNFLDEALAGAFHQLISRSLPDPGALAEDLGPEVQQGRLLFWSDHPDEQPLLRRLGLSGAFPQAPGQDVLAVTTQNADNNKIDAYLERSISDHVTYDPSTGSTTSTVTISLHNTAPASGLPSYVLGSYNGSGLPPGTNRTWLSVYSPLDLLRGSQGGVTLPMNATPELGVNAYSAYVNIPPGGTVTVSLSLSGRLRPGAAYTLHIRSQPMVIPDHATATISATSGWTLVDPAGGVFAIPERLESSRTVHFSAPSR